MRHRIIPIIIAFALATTVSSIASTYSGDTYLLQSAGSDSVDATDNRPTKQAVTDEPRSLPDTEEQLLKLAAAGQLTIRALRAWGQLPEPLMQTVLDLHGDGIDLMNADHDALLRLIDQAQQAASGPAFEQLELLQSLAQHMARFAAPPLAVEIDEPAIVDAPAVSSASARSQRSIARRILHEIDALEDWEHEAIERLYLELIDEAADTSEAEEAHWRLSNLYMRGFDAPRYAEAAGILEQYQRRYPASTLLDQRFGMFSTPGISVVESRLLYLYQEIEAWEKAAALFENLIPDPMSAPDPLLSQFMAYGRTLEALGREPAAIAIYEAYLDLADPPSATFKRFAHGRLQALGAMPTPPVVHDSLVAAAAAGSLEEVRRHIAAGADLEEDEQIDHRTQSTALQAAIAGDHFEVAEFLLAQGADPDHAGAGQAFPLHVALVKRHVPLFVLLLEHGADPDQPFQGEPLMHRISRDRQLGPDHQAALLKALLAAGIDIDARNARGLTALQEAVIHGNASAATALLQGGAKPEPADSQGFTMLHQAAMRNNAQLIPVLVAAGINVDDVNQRGETALHLAAEHGHGETVVALLDAGADPMLADQNDRTAISRAHRRGHADVVAAFAARGGLVYESLLEAAEDGDAAEIERHLARNPDLSATDDAGNTALHLAVGAGHAEAARLLLEAGSDANARNELQAVALHLAAANGDMDLISLLLAHGADEALPATTHAMDHEGNQALHYAAASGHIETVRWLLDQGVEIDPVNHHGETPLLLAFWQALELCQEASWEAERPLQPLAATHPVRQTVSLLLDQAARVDIIDDREGWSLLHYAAVMGDQALAESLLNQGLPLDSVSMDGLQSVHLAMMMGHAEWTAWMIEQGANPNLSEHGARLMHEALDRPYQSLHGIALLLEYGADVDARDEYGATVLLNTGWSDSALLELLLAHGADLDAADDDGRTLLSRLNEQRHRPDYLGLAERLIGLGADVSATWPELRVAVIRGETAKIENLLREGLDSEEGDWAWSILHSAAAAGQADALSMLLDHGFDLSAAEQISPGPMTLAAGSGNGAVVHVLLKHGADAGQLASVLYEAVVYNQDRELLTKLHASGLNLNEPYGYAPPAIFMARDPEMLLFLIEDLGLDVNNVEEGNNTPLLENVVAGEVAMTKILLDHGARTDSRIGLWDQTPLHLAVERDQAEILALLLEHGAEIEARDKDGRTALHLAADQGSLDAVRMLIAAGADLDARDDIDRTPQDLAATARHAEVLRFLRASR